MSKDSCRYRKRKIGDHELSPDTLMMGYGYDPHLSEGALKPPIFQTSTFVFENAQAGKDFFSLAYGLREKGPKEEPGLIYSRINNPNLEVLEDRLALWDRAERSLTFASGMAAISTTLWAFLRPGDVLVHSEPIYGGSEYLFHNILPQFGIKRIGFAADGGREAVDQALAEAQKVGRVAAIYVETPANPTNGLVDLEYCKQQGEALRQECGTYPPLIVDNTFLGPLWQTPLKNGADLVIHSLTKYVGGHSDLIAGSCSGSAEFIEPVAGMRTILGTMSDPFTGWMLIRSLETLRLRMESAGRGAGSVAEFLRRHNKVTSVNYLGFLTEGSEQYDVFQRHCKGAGSTFSFEVAGGEAEAFKVLDSLKVIKLAVSLGGTETLAQHPATMTHSDVPPEDQVRMGITSSMIRISVGVETPEDLVADLSQALGQI
jgi:methionine-gamma-lyase